jgi:TetR/AcrR family transcriptional regulator, transcriptional repressor for nem operon
VVAGGGLEFGRMPGPIAQPMAASIVEPKDRSHYEWISSGLSEERLKVSGRKVAENRSALIATAQRLLQEQGFKGAGVAEISRAAGLTQGALYGQFESKDALAAEATREAAGALTAAWKKIREAEPDVLQAYMDAYLSDEHSHNVGGGCFLAACVSEVRRQDPAICKAFVDGFTGLVELIEGALPATLPPEEARRRSLALVSAMVGSVAMARAVEGIDPGLSKEVIAAARSELWRLSAAQAGPDEAEAPVHDKS